MMQGTGKSVRVVCLLLAAGTTHAGAQEPVELPHPATEPQTDQEIVGPRAELPDGFPRDVPLYDAMKSPTLALNRSAWTVRGQTPDSGVRVARQLNESMRDEGWRRIADDNNPSEHHMTFAKGDRTVDVTLTLEDQVTLLRMEVPHRAGDS